MLKHFSHFNMLQTLLKAEEKKMKRQRGWQNGEHFHLKPLTDASFQTIQLLVLNPICNPDINSSHGGIFSTHSVTGHFALIVMFLSLMVNFSALCCVLQFLLLQVYYFSSCFLAVSKENAALHYLSRSPPHLAHQLKPFHNEWQGAIIAFRLPQK